MSQAGDQPPLLFVDIDGVISLFGFDAAHPPPGRLHWINGVLHCISPDCGEHLARLRDHYELVWASGWEETANEYLPHLLGLGQELPYLSFDGRARFGTAHWKTEAIADHAGPERALAWIDDSIDEACRAWADARPAPTLLVPTHSELGMQQEHVELLIEWARRAA